jgi:hypothetical protein
MFEDYISYGVVTQLVSLYIYLFIYIYIVIYIYIYLYIYQNNIIDHRVKYNKDM